MVISCGYKVTIDNPSAERLVVKVDDQEIVLEKEVFKTLVLTEGDHVMKFRDSSFPFTFKKDKDGQGELLINPTRSIYVIDKTIYTRLSLESYNRQLRAVPSNDKTNEMFITGEWTYNLKDEAPGPTNAGALMKDNDYQLKIVKIYRGKDYWYGDGRNALGEKK
ncbi:hypothetical protein [Chitinophaga sp. CF118]|uniref:hypothetical protein n=1 Tax=Chitinophaga sp. CF118 TaxID=1884367 RepID=UPI001160B133|nr:hypothetical protein [Chitinophaga sp. CF118]